MYRRSSIVSACSVILFFSVAHAQTPPPTPLMSMPTLAPGGSPKIDVRVGSIQPGQMVPSENAFCTADGSGGATAAANKSPRISWSKGPEATKSYAVVVYDPESPAEHREWMN